MSEQKPWNRCIFTSLMFQKSSEAWNDLYIGNTCIGKSAAGTDYHDCHGNKNL
jgi:hypothetical protein